VTNHAISGLLPPAQPSHVDFGFREPACRAECRCSNSTDLFRCPWDRPLDALEAELAVPSAGSAEVIARFVRLALLPFD
jgi:hypothetical protein